MIVQIFQFLDPMVAAQWKQVLTIANSSYDDFRVQVLFLHPHTAWLNSRIHVLHLSALSLQLKYARYDHIPALWQEALLVISKLINYSVITALEHARTLDSLSADHIMFRPSSPPRIVMSEMISANMPHSTQQSCTDFGYSAPPGLSKPPMSA